MYKTKLLYGNYELPKRKLTPGSIISLSAWKALYKMGFVARVQPIANYLAKGGKVKMLPYAYPTPDIADVSELQY